MSREVTRKELVGLMNRVAALEREREDLQKIMAALVKHAQVTDDRFFDLNERVPKKIIVSPHEAKA